ncbi:MAG: outer membrane protein assembly factor [Gemmatimonadetes bacterium]|nr:outer membrane protein assembly factor [Gemmatimonadota bacterium]
MGSSKWTAIIALSLGVLCTSRAAGAQASDGADEALSVSGSFADACAAALYRAAVKNRDRVHDMVVRYQALVRQRIGARLRMPLKDRTLYRAEAADRIWWERDGETVVQVLARREQTPLGLNEHADPRGAIGQFFDPSSDRLLFGFVATDDDMGRNDPDDFWFEHPLVPENRDDYRFSTGDTVTVSLPDGRRIRAVELRVVPKVADVHRMVGSLWIEPESGALVRAVYRLSDTLEALRDLADVRREDERGEFKYVPPMFKPWRFDLSMVAVDYGLWDGKVWLPRSMRAEGVVTAGVLKAPGEVDVSYQMESVVIDSDLEADNAAAESETARHALQRIEEERGDEGGPDYVAAGWSHSGHGSDRRTVRYLVPTNRRDLLTSPELPPPVWEDAPGFATEDELSSAFGVLADLPEPPHETTPKTLRWGLQRTDLVRYNRVEGLSVGARGQIRPNRFVGSPVGPLSLTATVRLGTADLQPDARLDVTRERFRSRLTLSVFHGLAAVDEDARHLDVGNSILAAMVGRDDGDYYRRSGAWLEWSPPAAARQTVRVRAYGEYHQPAQTNTDLSLLHVGSSSWTFRPNLQADEGWEVGGLVRLEPWWGTDPRSPQGGLSLLAQAAGGDFEYARASIVGRLAVPLPADFRVGLEAGGGTSWGHPPVQRHWLIGGPTTLRGYGPDTFEGTSYLRGRAELAHLFDFGALSLFSDVAWAGDRDAASLDAALTSVGAGLSILDGLIRVDLGWGLRSPRGSRLDAYLDGIL